MSQQKPKKSFKRGVCALVMKVLGKGIVYGYKVDENIRADFDGIGETFSVKLCVDPVGPAIVFGKDGKGVPYASKCDITQPADIEMRFKGVGGAFKMMTGQMGVSAGYAQHRFTVKGDLYKVMAIARVINAVEASLFPKFIARGLMNPVPKRAVNEIRFVFGTLFTK